MIIILIIYNMVFYKIDLSRKIRKNSLLPKK